MIVFVWKRKDWNVLKLSILTLNFVKLNYSCFMGNCMTHTNPNQNTKSPAQRQTHEKPKYTFRSTSHTSI